MNCKILLSICLPTYNRKNKAKDQINRILPQIINHPNIEFIVSDNCSSDGSYLSFMELFQDAPIKIFRQNENLGLVGNLHFLFNEAKGKYVWFISDDDIVFENTVNKILKLLEHSSKPFYLLNFKVESNGKPDIFAYWQAGCSPKDCFKQNWGGFGLLSAQILKKEIFEELFNHTKKTYNLCHPVAYALYGIFLKGGEMITSDIFLLYHSGPSSWVTYSLEVGSIYNFEAIEHISSLITKREQSELFEILISSPEIKQGCVRYIVKKHDIKFAFYLLREGFALTIISCAIKYIIGNSLKKLSRDFNRHSKISS